MCISKYAWACVLTQACIHVLDGKEKTSLHPITYISGLFTNSHLNGDALTKVAYIILVPVKYLSFYLEDADITLRSDDLPLQKFPDNNTSNSKVNNWAMEIEQY